MKVVILDSYALTPGDLDWSALYAMGLEVVEWPRTKREEIIPRLQGADFAILNKANINEEILVACPGLKWVGVTATGVDSLDLAACRRHGVPVANVPGYSTHSVAQLTFALLLSLCQCPARYDTAVRAGYWQLEIPARFGLMPQHEIWGKTLGLVGFGAIAKQVAALAQAFGAQVVCHTRTIPAAQQAPGIEFVSLETLWQRSDFISLHCPATPQTRSLVNAQTLARCKPGALLVNTARGALVDEQAVAAALHSGQLGGFAADVLCTEPPTPDNPLLHAPRTLLTPHIAWATPESLGRLSAAVCENLASYLAGGTRNIVN